MNLDFMEAISRASVALPMLIIPVEEKHFSGWCVTCRVVVMPEANLTERLPYNHKELAQRW